MKKNVIKTLIIITILTIVILGIYFIFFHHGNNTNSNIEITGLKINKDIINMTIGTSEKLSVKVLPENSSDVKLIWTIDNDLVASVSNDGLVTGNSVGSAKVTVQTEDGKYSDVCFIEVWDTINEIIEIEEKEIELKIGESAQINVTIKPEQFANDNLTWSSSDTGIVDVDLNGIVTGITSGEAIIKVKGSNNETECLVRVMEPIKYTVAFNPNGGSISPTSIEIVEGSTIGNLPTPTRNGYKFLGWYTSVTGGSKVTKNQVINDNITFYAHWERIIIIMTDTYKIPSGYTEVSRYNSDTLKYIRMKKNDGNNYYALIWVKDAYNQLNSANNNYSSNTRKNLLNNEIKSFNYQNKGMIAVNGSFTINGRSNTPVIVTKGTQKVNDNYNSKYKYSTLTLSKDGWLLSKSLSTTSAARTWLTSISARNTWAITTYETSNWVSNTDGGSDFRTSICQIDENNFVLYVGYSKGIHAYMKELHDLFGCKIVVNLDGGGSSGIYYKTANMSTIGEFYEYPKERTRKIADMLYFVEQ